jgi:hypothetical protein
MVIMLGRFRTEAALAPWTKRRLRRKHFEGYHAVEAGVEGLVDDPQCPFTELLADFLVRECAPDHVGYTSDK